MEIRMKFDLPEDKDAYILASKGSNYYFALLDIVSCLRSHSKYEDHTSANKNPDDLVEELYTRIYEILDSNNVNLDEVG